MIFYRDETEKSVMLRRRLLSISLIFLAYQCIEPKRREILRCAQNDIVRAIRGRKETFPLCASA
jgi:hypothetical protein